jgi:hypothetical protein
MNVRSRLVDVNRPVIITMVDSLVDVGLVMNFYLTEKHVTRVKVRAVSQTQIHFLFVKQVRAVSQAQIHFLFVKQVRAVSQTQIHFLFVKQVRAVSRSKTTAKFYWKEKKQ